MVLLLSTKSPSSSLPQIQSSSGAGARGRGGADLAAAQPRRAARKGAEEDEGGRGRHLRQEPAAQTHHGRRVHQTRHSKEQALKGKWWGGGGALSFFFSSAKQERKILHLDSRREDSSVCLTPLNSHVKAMDSSF